MDRATRKAGRSFTLKAAKPSPSPPGPAKMSRTGIISLDIQRWYSLRSESCADRRSNVTPPPGLHAIYQPQVCRSRFTDCPRNPQLGARLTKAQVFTYPKEA